MAAFSGIATPESFEKFLRDLGALLVARERFLDHYRYTEEDFEALFDLAKREGAECLVTTEKDAVRIPENRAWPLPLLLPAAGDRDHPRGASDFDEAVGRICFAQSGSRKPGSNRDLLAFSAEARKGLERRRRLQSVRSWFRSFPSI